MRSQPARHPTTRAYLPEAHVTWLLVAHRSGARLYEFATRASKPSELKRWSHPQGRLKEIDLTTDRPSLKIGTPGTTSRSTTEPEQSAVDRTADAFARELVRELQSGRNRQGYERLILVAEARFLGKLREAIDPATAKRIVGTESKDLGYYADPELEHAVDAIHRRVIEDLLD